MNPFTFDAACGVRQRVEPFGGNLFPTTSALTKRPLLGALDRRIDSLQFTTQGVFQASLFRDARGIAVGAVLRVVR